MFHELANGVWPTMITPFTADNRIDYPNVDRLVAWYQVKGVAGVFAVCQSSEMFFLTLEERVSLASAVKKAAGRQMQVIASGHVSERYADQVDELNRMAETGVDALVLITNRLAAKEESDEQWIANLEKLLADLPASVPLGFYECPYPYKRLLTPAQVAWCQQTGRFFFLKDTSCDIDNIRQKMAAIGAGSLKLFNANTTTLLESLKAGASGYSGIMANMHPELYVWLLKHWSEQPAQAARLQNFLTVSSLIERQVYPVNAKQYLNLEGLPLNLQSRSRSAGELTATGKDEVRQLWELTQDMIRSLTAAP